jgi:hypothetical protein
MLLALALLWPAGLVMLWRGGLGLAWKLALSIGLAAWFCWVIASNIDGIMFESPLCSILSLGAGVQMIVNAERAISTGVELREAIDAPNLQSVALAHAFDVDPGTAAVKYKGKLIKVTGSQADDGGLIGDWDDARIHLIGGGDDNDVVCDFGLSYQVGFGLQLDRNGQVTIAGICRGSDSSGDIVLTDCVADPN